MKRGAALILCLLCACQAQTTREWQTLTVQSGALDLSLHESGEVVSQSETSLRIPFDGKMTQLLPEGTVVKKNQVIARMDTSSQQTELDNARFSWDEARFDQDLAALNRQIRIEQTQNTQEQARFKARLEELKLLKLKTERDPVALTRVREGLKALAQRQEILSLEARERKRLFELGYLSREERDQAQLQLEESQKEQKRLEAELLVLQQGPRPQEIQKQKVQLEKARAAIKLADREGKVQVRVAEVMKRSAESRIKTYHNRMNYYQDLIRRGQLTAPLPGTLVYGKMRVGQDMIPVKAGDSVKEGIEAVRLVDLQQPLIRLTLNEIDAPQVQLGQKVKVSLDAWPELVLKGEVTRLLPIARQTLSNDALEIQGITCEIRLEKPDPHLRPGMTAQVDIQIQAMKGVLTVPTQALQQSKSESFVWVLEAGKAQKRKIKTGKSDALNTLVREGLKAGDTVILNPPPSGRGDSDA
ncbi:hypothetical protein COW36_20135 [bacterium (Candidatus Blackallbacteria) CG17_big_fil_post_rev_8_21_14_2_50_48_46]|uniref:RND efflux pump membrane fusion protein barrel-sandwich domain-containing protein n=1 Tax=bacterium (Candidatus Blackallbacteria) CG17_big_fil_post_rev_8_21_14_2_50_48_46 TaxID=2014261 RepID=A0A2M7FZL0_9BACT|nr:MAG: hypothetical protein COW64_22460 [bacterium (Candidatus Blackallbacteria) CG18_big_fil_WC_8_21_14_2_50_49_26]PIW14718.1 MAG: hypothetical protein COW36_20135 [bacterium (Candidatus Blackallbacteria) CG17_big_fil_post_rev_8_21_14_2_50_48_46]PIW50820.1 MAG: hypothetical protein COW20_00950 [bacterium (Candidatus Blackallbacteria) CG13_big_fil_rev_8_21_14_2_50_49_14]